MQKWCNLFPIENGYLFHRDPQGARVNPQAVCSPIRFFHFTVGCLKRFPDDPPYIPGIERTIWVIARVRFLTIFVFNAIELEVFINYFAARLYDDSRESIDR
jgi:hypothetical protein